MTLSEGSKKGMWTLLKRTPAGKVDGKRIPAKWLCVCDCGTRREVMEQHLKSGHSRACGCQRALRHHEDMSIAFGAGNIKRRPLR